MTGHRAINSADGSLPSQPPETWAQLWSLVWEELGQRLLSLADLDDPQRPAAAVLRKRAALRASHLIVELEHTTADTGWWSARRRQRLRRGVARALRRCQYDTYPEMQELIEVGVHNLRVLRCAFDMNPNPGDRADPSARPWAHTYAALGKFRVVGTARGGETG